MKVKVNHEACIGCGACTSVADDLFEINDEGLSTAKVETVPEDKVQEAKDAIETCPTGAIVETE
ncbi:MAG: ferredoxin [Bacilli bacterium]|nr:ferredoxin [Bacilli bacterium]